MFTFYKYEGSPLPLTVLRVVLLHTEDVSQVKNFVTQYTYFIHWHYRMNNSTVESSESFSYYDFQWFTEGLLLMLVSCIGLIGNACWVVTCAKQRIQRVFHRLLLTLATFDSVSFHIAENCNRHMITVSIFNLKITEKFRLSSNVSF